MKLIIIIFSQLLFITTIFCQSYDANIEKLLSQISLDSLVSYVRILSGEDSVNIKDTTTIITHRVSEWGNDLSADYIKQKLESFKLDIYDQVYSVKGRNIYAIQRGQEFPDEYFILCAHYDAVTYYCADDNASGVATVLEAARVLSNYQIGSSIIYAFWDEEEIGHFGSEYFAAKIYEDSTNIKAVLNLDMIGWDDNDDSIVGVPDLGWSFFNYLSRINFLYDLSLNLFIFTPQLGFSSDFMSFTEYHYRTGVLFETAWYADPDSIWKNPNYHSENDRIETFNLNFYHNVSKLGIGTIASFASIIETVSVKESDHRNSYKLAISNYPNPFNNSTKIQYVIPEDDNVILELFNNLGQSLDVLFSGHIKSGISTFSLDGEKLTSGVYFVFLRTSTNFRSHKILLLK